MNRTAQKHMQTASAHYEDAIDNPAQPAVTVAKLITAIIHYRHALRELGYEPDSKEPA